MGIIVGDNVQCTDVKQIKLVETVFKIPPLTRTQIEFINFFSRWNCTKKGIVLKQFLSPHDKNSLNAFNKNININDEKPLIERKKLVNLNKDQLQLQN